MLFNKNEYLLKSVIKTSFLSLLKIICTSNPLTGSPLRLGGHIVLLYLTQHCLHYNTITKILKIVIFVNLQLFFTNF